MPSLYSCVPSWNLDPTLPLFKCYILVTLHGHKVKFVTYTCYCVVYMCKEYVNCCFSQKIMSLGLRFMSEYA